MLKSTKSINSQNINVLVHGASGAGKTRLAGTLRNPLIISAEAGLLSLREYDFPVFEINSFKNLEQAYPEALNGNYDWIVIDSLSELAELCLLEEKRKVNDIRQAYTAMADNMGITIRTFRDLNKNVYFTSKQEKVKNEVTGEILFSPSAPGEKFKQSIPYFFDEVFCLIVGEDDEGNIERKLLTNKWSTFDAKDRSGALSLWEEPNLTNIQSKILGDKNND